jgi:hypothetical protein
MVDFQRINRGVVLTALEYFSGYLLYMPDADYYKKLINTVLKQLEKTEYQLCKEAKDENTKQRLNRNCYYLIYRHLSKDIRFELNANKESWRGDEKQSIEYLLRQILISKKGKKLESEIEQLCNQIKNAGGTTGDIFYKKLKTDYQVLMNTDCFRFFVDLRIYCKNAKINIPIADYDKFIWFLLKNNSGSSRYHYIENNLPESKQLPKSSLKNLGHIKNSIGFPKFGTKKRKKQNNTFRDGIDLSHKEPFSKYGEGPTGPEPASINRSRGANE